MCTAITIITPDATHLPGGLPALVTTAIGPQVNDEPHYHYRAKERPALPKHGIAKEYWYAFKVR